ncbi:hypothetical protein D781_1667 [Serratia sp. FGI94]|nr:hypothetical protein D781_1667 [Serratia sp. FGI94]
MCQNFSINRYGLHFVIFINYSTYNQPSPGG